MGLFLHVLRPVIDHQTCAFCPDDDRQSVVELEATQPIGWLLVMVTALPMALYGQRLQLGNEHCLCGGPGISFRMLTIPTKYTLRKWHSLHPVDLLNKK